ncbi:MAG: J domain-containing protein [Caulobacteraceae bacterium]|nr:J domain-containing protein [Caulobacteraceae bacterium]
MVPVLLVVTLIFGVLFLTRLGGVYRAELARRWPTVLLAGAAFLCLLRGLIGPAITLGSLAALSWALWPQIDRRALAPPSPPQDAPEDFAARRLLGVGPNATADEIRGAYRAKMAQAHPDRGGSHNEAARLAAARDRLLKKKR